MDSNVRDLGPAAVNDLARKIMGEKKAEGVTLHSSVAAGVVAMPALSDEILALCRNLLT
jgi:hypothetical protein